MNSRYRVGAFALVPYICADCRKSGVGQPNQKRCATCGPAWQRERDRMAKQQKRDEQKRKAGR